jgi:hypothetical protein
MAAPADPNEKGAGQGAPNFAISISLSNIDTAIAPSDLHARRLRRQFAIGDYLAATLALLIWGVAR